MKSARKIISGLLTFALAISMFIIPVNAETAHNYSANFDTYVGTWNGTTVTTSAKYPTVGGGGITNYSDIKAYNGITSGAPANSPYGTSIKIYQEQHALETGSSYIYGGFKYTMNSGQSIDDSIYFESSIYTEPNDAKSYMAKSINFRNYGTGRNGNSVRPVLFDGTKITTFGIDTGVAYEAGKWLDFKIWLNLSTGHFRTQVWSGGEMLSDIRNTTGVSSLGASVTQIIYMHNVYSSHATGWKKDTNGNYIPQITYVDNFKLQEVFGFENPDPGKLATFDFEDYKNTTNIGIGPANGSWGGWRWGNSNSHTHGIFAEATDRGTSLAIVAPVYDGPVDSSYKPTDTTLPNGNLTASQLQYPMAYYDLNSTYKVTDAAYLKTSVRFPDLNFGSARVQIGNIVLFNTSPTAHMNDYSKGNISTFKGDTGMNLKLDNWYDIEAMLDVATGYIWISIDDGEECYEYKGYAPSSQYTPGTAVSRLQYIYWNRTPARDWSKPTRWLVDDIQFGSWGAMYVPGADDGDAPYDFSIDKRFTTTGFDKVIDMADEVQVAFSNRVDRTTFTASTVKVNGTAVNANDLVFDDDQHLKLTFDKTQNTSYKVEFTGVEDIYGNTLNDSITFSTAARDMYVSDVRFTRGGVVQKKTTPGTIKVSFDGADYAQSGEEILFIAGLYHAGKLVSAEMDSFAMTATETEYSVNVTIPDDNKYYVIKTFIWDEETFKPLAEKSMLTAVEGNIPVSIVKMDAINATSSDLNLYEDIKEWLLENEVKAAIGFVPRNLDALSGENLEKTGARVRAIYDNDFIEMWDHQYGGIDCTTATYEEQIDNLQKSTDALAKIGMTYKVWGPLYNACNQYTAAALNAFPNYEVVLIRRTKEQLTPYGMLDESNNFKVLHEIINVETGLSGETVPLMIEDMAKEWNKAVFDRVPYLILQWHPNYHVGKEFTDANGVVWGGEGNTMFDQLLWFKNQGTTFMTPLEYIDYLKNF